jgi:hypothetical protein
MTKADDVRLRLGEVISLLQPAARSSNGLDFDQLASDVRVAIHKLENVLSLLGHTP